MATVLRNSLSLLAFAACICFAQTGGRGLLPAPPPSAYQESGSHPEKPFVPISGEHAFSRSVFQEPSGPANTRIEVVDLVIAPRQSLQMPAGAGPVVIDLRSGTGTVSAGTRLSGLSLQSPVSVAAGFPFAIKNPGLLPLMVRLYKVEGK